MQGPKGPQARGRGRPLRPVAMAVLAVLGCRSPGPVPESEPSERPVPVAAWVERAERAESKGDLDGALDAYREAVARTPWNTRLRSALAATYAKRAARTRDERGVFGLEAAEADLRRARELEPEDPVIQRNLAVLLVERAVREMDPERARSFREEARALDAEVRLEGEDRRADLERRLDLAYQLVERGQIDAGIERLEMLLEAHPQHRPTARLLARAIVRKASIRAGRGRHGEAGTLLDRAVALYAELSGGSAAPEPAALRDEIGAAHHNRVVAWHNASRPDLARRAFVEAERAGFRFPDLAHALGDPADRVP